MNDQTKTAQLNHNRNINVFEEIYTALQKNFCFFPKEPYKRDDTKTLENAKLGMELINEFRK